VDLIGPAIGPGADLGLVATGLGVLSLFRPDCATVNVLKTGLSNKKTTNRQRVPGSKKALRQKPEDLIEDFEFLVASCPILSMPARPDVGDDLFFVEDVFDLLQQLARAKQT
jgi:hypothetical protein